MASLLICVLVALFLSQSRCAAKPQYYYIDVKKGTYEATWSLASSSSGISGDSLPRVVLRTILSSTHAIEWSKNRSPTPQWVRGGITEDGNRDNTWTEILNAPLENEITVHGGTTDDEQRDNTWSDILRAPRKNLANEITATFEVKTPSTLEFDRPPTTFINKNGRHLVAQESPMTDLFYRLTPVSVPLPHGRHIFVFDNDCPFLVRCVRGLESYFAQGYNWHLLKPKPYGNEFAVEFEGVFDIQGTHPDSTLQFEYNLPSGVWDSNGHHVWKGSRRD